MDTCKWQRCREWERSVGRAHKRDGGLVDSVVLVNIDDDAAAVDDKHSIKRIRKIRNLLNALKSSLLLLTVENK